MKKRLLALALLLLVPAFKAGAQTKGVSDRMAADVFNQVTDDAQISARFALIAGEWNLLYATIPPGRLAPVIQHVVFSHTGNAYTATLVGMKTDIRASDSKYVTFSSPDIYKLTEVDDAIQSGFPRTELIFQNAFTDAKGGHLTGSFDIFLVPSTARIVGTDYADFPTGDSSVTPPRDGFWAGIRGNVADIDAFERAALDLFQQYSGQPDFDHQSVVFGHWSGYGQ